jgi:UDP:flavonoid glycosyltransferase YjiC (YdhE family)
MTQVVEQPPQPLSALPPPRRKLKVLLTSFGSHGDVHPFIAVAAAMKARGHEVALIANSHFETPARNAGVELVSSGPSEEYDQILNHPNLWRRGKGRGVLIDLGVARIIPRVYHAIAERYEPGRTVVRASPWSVGARIAEDKLGVPLTTMIVSPQTLMSAQDPGILMARLVPLWARKRLVRWAERKILDPALMPGINKLRAELGLGPVRNIQSKWLFAPRRVICLWPEWFSRPQTDWPQQARTTGFVLYDGSGGRDLPDKLKEFLAAGPPPIAFVPSTAMLNAGRFFSESVKACRRMGKRGVLLSKGTEHVPRDLPDSCLHVDYAPFGKLFPQCRGVVHQGAIGTAAFAMSAALPQLAIPHGTDQPDNAARLARLGLCTVLHPRLYRERIIAKLMNRLMWSKHVAHQCAQYQRLIREARPLDQICQLAEEVAEMPASR